MSLPPGFLDELRARVPLSQVVGRGVVWDMKKSNMAKGDWWAPCPFHQERTASFHVDDRKGFYYCFGCHAKGDALTFLKDSGNIGFMEAVEALAREAGMAMPARDPADAARADRQTQLIAVVEEAVKFYRLQLRTGAAAAARAYLEKRRLSQATLDRWEIGFAPDQRQFLLAALRAKGIGDEMTEAAGLIARAEDGSPYDRFRGRILFPIRDARGRAISFGGRAMDPNARAKYLNGPETELFDKGRTLFNIAPAREAAGKGQPLIVAEGYMDVIALVDAGFGAAVAPLGTAVTEAQLALMWRIHPEPVIALDGDTAGLRAALRVTDLALPMLEAGRGLRFAILPGGQDPDDLIRAEGPAAMQAVLDRAEPMARLIWRRETEGQALDSPERKAALRKRLRDLIARIRDPDLSRYYGEAFQAFEVAELRPADRALQVRGQTWKPARGGPAGALPQTKATMLARGETQRAIEYIRETAIVAVCLRYPQCVAPFESALETLDLADPGHGLMLRTVLACHLSEPPAAIYDRVCAAVGRAEVERLMSSAHIHVLPAIKNLAADQLATDTLAEQLAKLSSDRALRREIGEAQEDMAGHADEGVTFRLTRAADARNAADRSAGGQGGDDAETTAAMSRHLQEMLDAQVWIKRKH